MGSKTKIIVLHMKEIIYTAVFVVLGILLIILLAVMFSPDKKETSGRSTQHYTPGTYTSTVSLNNTTLEVEVSVDEDHINSIRFANLDETVTTMFPLIQPAMEEIADQVVKNQTLDDLTFPEDTPYTSQVIADAIAEALEKAAAS